MKKELLLAALMANLAINAIAADAPKKETKAKTTIAKKAETPKAPPSGTKPTPKKKVEAK